MRPSIPAFCTRLAGAIVLFMGFGLCMSCLSVMEQRMGLVGKGRHLEITHGIVAVPGIARNLSGVTASPLTGTLFAVTNSPQAVFELGPNGSMLRRISLEGFSDTEDIAHVGGQNFAIVEERRGLIRLARITPQTSVIHARDCRTIDLGSRHENNKGFESLAFDPATRSLLTMRELPPYELVSVPLDAYGMPGTPHSTMLDLDVDDVAALGRDSRGNLWILSEASSCLVRIDSRGRSGLRLVIDGQGASCEPEGLAFGTYGDVFVVGEPNILITARIDSR